MKINEVIKLKRKELGLTQEQVANALQVSIPAVNKWESGVSYPDITSLPVLARLLKTDLNTLLSFKENLTDFEIVTILNEISNKMLTGNVEDIFVETRQLILEYPNCDKLICYLATILKGSLEFLKIENKDAYEEEIYAMLDRVSNSENEEVRGQAIATLVAHFIDKKQFDKAHELIARLPKIHIDKDRKSVV